MMKKIKQVFFSLLLLLPVMASAQQPAEKPAEEAPRPQNIKLLDEYKDGKGNIVRIVQFTQGRMRVTQTIITPLKAPTNIRIAFSPDTLKKHLLRIVVSKSSYSLRLMYGNRTIRSYKAVFGPNPTKNKLMEGDRCTPEGSFTIANKNPNSKYDRFMGISYPNDSSTRRFNAAKAAGSIPASATIGGNVGIHGIWPGGDDLIEMGIGWTDGCIALKNKDIEELFSFVGVGTRVTVQK